MFSYREEIYIREDDLVRKAHNGGEVIRDAERNEQSFEFLPRIVGNHANSVKSDNNHSMWEQVMAQ